MCNKESLMKTLYDILAAKRDGGILTREDLSGFLQKYLDGEVTDYQMSALLMAIFIRGLNAEELAVFADTMLRSGRVLDFSHLNRIAVDKHSTGGVGDKISIPLAPLLAALNFAVPMISGRGLGHTGGTLDKLESIPGFSVNLTAEQFAGMVEAFGVSMIGQTPDIAPLDKKLYALRDVTGTVESIPLIASSIMSKKLAEGIKGLVLDVKVGSGAFMKTFEAAEKLAVTMQAIGESLGTKVAVVFSDMEEPLGYTVGNSLEIEESIDVMKGIYIPEVTELIRDEAASLMLLFNKTLNREDARALAKTKLDDGSALKIFREMVRLQGGNPEVADNPRHILPQAKYEYILTAENAGFIHHLAAIQFGKALIALGGGRERKEDAIDHAVGFIFKKKKGTAVQKGEPVALIRYNDQARLKKALELIKDAVIINDTPPQPHKLILGYR